MPPGRLQHAARDDGSARRTSSAEDYGTPVRQQAEPHRPAVLSGVSQLGHETYCNRRGGGQHPTAYAGGLTARNSLPAVSCVCFRSPRAT